jgi:hypothetical protein
MTQVVVCTDVEQLGGRREAGGSAPKQPRCLELRYLVPQVIPEGHGEACSTRASRGRGAGVVAWPLRASPRRSASDAEGTRSPARAGRHNAGWSHRGSLGPTRTSATKVAPRRHAAHPRRERPETVAQWRPRRAHPVWKGGAAVARRAPVDRVNAPVERFEGRTAVARSAAGGPGDAPVDVLSRRQIETANAAPTSKPRAPVWDGAVPRRECPRYQRPPRWRPTSRRRPPCEAGSVSPLTGSIRCR